MARLCISHYGNKTGKYELFLGPFTFLTRGFTDMHQRLCNSANEQTKITKYQPADKPNDEKITSMAKAIETIRTDNLFYLTLSCF